MIVCNEKMHQLNKRGVLGKGLKIWANAAILLQVWKPCINIQRQPITTKYYFNLLWVVDA